MNYTTIEQRLKNMAVGAAVLAFITTISVVIGIIMIAEIGTNYLVIGCGVSAFISMTGYFIMRTVAGTWAGEVKEEAEKLTKSLSEFSAGNLPLNLRSDKQTELGQIEAAVVQFSMTQKSLLRDVETLSKLSTNSNVIDENTHAGNYREMVKGINKIYVNFTESESVVFDLKRNNEQISRDLAALVSAVEKSRAETETAKTQATDARNEIEKIREELNKVSRELTKAEESLRKTEQAPRPSAFANRTAGAGFSRTSENRLATSSTRARSNDPPAAIKSIKIEAPSGAHEYDRKDYGKY